MSREHWSQRDQFDPLFACHVQNQRCPNQNLEIGTGAWLNQAHGVVGLPVHKNIDQLPCLPDVNQLDWNELVLLPLSNSCHQRIRIPCPKCHISIMFHKILQKSYLSFVHCLAEFLTHWSLQGGVPAILRRDPFRICGCIQVQGLSRMKPRV